MHGIVMNDYRIVSFISLILLTATIQGCDTLIFKIGNGEQAIRSESLDTFHEVFINGNYDVFLEKGAMPKIVIKTDENLTDLITVDSRDGTLVISNLERIKGSDGIKIFITYVDLNRIVCGGASKIFSASSIDEKDLEISMSGAGLIEMNLQVERLKVHLSGAGLIKLEGYADHEEINLTGAGSLEAFELESNVCEISISGIGGAEVNVKESLVAKISGMGGIQFMGSPKEIRREVSGIGKIKEAR